MFEVVLEQYEKELKIPYPERSALIRELRTDMESLYQSLRQYGDDHQSSVRQVLAEFRLDKSDLEEIEYIYAPIFQKMMNCFPSSSHHLLGDCFKLSFLSIFIFFLFTEVPMFDFILQGGLPVQVLILGTALIALMMQATRIVKWFLIKDHSQISLNQNTNTPILLAGFVFLMGCLGTTLGYYMVLTKWASGVITIEQLKVGIYEPLPCIILATSFSAIILVSQMLIQSKLRSMNIPNSFA